MEGYVKIVDLLGGVDVTNNRDFTSVYHFPKGAQHLNGDQALAYIRMRKEDPQGDFGRTERQRAVLSNAVDRVTELNSIAKLPKLMSHLATNIRTNLTMQNMLDLALEYRPLIQNVETLSLKGVGETTNGIYYYSVSTKERQRIQTELLSRLGATS
jgi:anionic cell wall polymer biosynthesis LytR-Cps2A-Psr (LCP) family protein